MGWRARAALSAAAILLLAACTSSPADPDDPEPGPDAQTTGQQTPSGANTVAAPGPLDGRLFGADLLVWSQEPLSADVVAKVKDVPGVARAERISLAGVSIRNERVVTVAAVDPATYRRFTPAASAQLQEAWVRVAKGELAIDPELGKQLQDEENFVTLGNDKDAPELHIGAFAPQVPRVDAVVNTAWGKTLGMKMGNALLINTGSASPQKVRPKLEKLVDAETTVQLLGPDLDTSVEQTAFLTGGSVAAAVGTFTYRPLEDGRIEPDPAWVAANIRTETVPILGEVRCHKAMLPQLRAALTEIVDKGLADEIHPDEYAGCYYPRYIAGSTSLSLHSFGIAVDLNVPGNQRGTVGEIDREVVAIFKSWGFGWGGDWSYTDPMHFEMNAVVDVR